MEVNREKENIASSLDAHIGTELGCYGLPGTGTDTGTSTRGNCVGLLILGWSWGTGLARLAVV